MSSLQRLQVRLPAEPGSVPALRGEVRAYAAAAGLAPDAVGLLALAVTEAATNAVVHGFVGRPLGHIELIAEPGDGSLVVHVRDDGRGMTPRHDSPGLGLGLPTIGRCCERFDVSEGPGGRGTDVCMQFAVAGLRAAGEPAPIDPRAAAPAATPGEPDGLSNRIRGILGAITEAITVSSPDGRVVYANDAAAELLGARSAAEVLATGAEDLTDRFVITREDGQPVAYEDLPATHVLAGGRSGPLLTRSVLKATGRSRWLLTSARPLEDAGVRYAVSTIIDVTASKEAERRQRFLAEASVLLSSSLDLSETLRHVSDLAVPALADWCAVDLATADGLLERAALSHIDPEKVRLGEEIHRRYPPDPARAEGAYGVLAGGEPLFVPELPDALLKESIEDPEHLELLRRIGMRSVILAPMTARGRVQGVLTLVTADSARAFTEEDLAFALDVARRAGVAVDTARRFAELDRR